MGIFKALVVAATAYLRVLPIIHLRKLYNEHDQISDEILSLGASGTPADLLRIEVLAKRRGRINQQIRSIRTASGDTKQG
jgi:uncharacterized protein YdcH (DUF465 family)